jgi:hypothetical protein
MAVPALLFHLPRCRIRESARGLWSAEYNSGGMKLAKDFALPRNASGREAAEYDDDDNRSLLACKRMSQVSACRGKAKRLVCKQCLQVGKASVCKSTNITRVQLEYNTALFMMKLALGLFHFLQNIMLIHRVQPTLVTDFFVSLCCCACVAL